MENVQKGRVKTTKKRKYAKAGTKRRLRDSQTGGQKFSFLFLLFFALSKQHPRLKRVHFVDMKGFRSVAKAFVPTCTPMDVNLSGRVERD
jgi:hypothetical protein